MVHLQRVENMIMELARDIRHGAGQKYRAKVRFRRLLADRASEQLDPYTIALMLAEQARQHPDRGEGSYPWEVYLGLHEALYARVMDELQGNSPTSLAGMVTVFDFERDPIDVLGVLTAAHSKVALDLLHDAAREKLTKEDFNEILASVGNLVPTGASTADLNRFAYERICTALNLD